MHKFYETYTKWLSTHKAMQIFNIGRFGASLLTGILLVNLGLPLAELDKYELFFFLGNLLSFFWVVGLQKALLSYFPKIEIGERANFKGTFFLFICLLSGITAMSLYLLVYVWTQYYGATSVFLAQNSLLPILAAYTAINIPSYFIHLLFLLEEKPIHIVRFGFWNFLLQLLVIVVPVALGYGLYVGLLALLGLAVIRLLYGGFYFFREFGWHLDKRALWAVGGVSVPLILHALLGNAVEYVDGYLVNRYFQEEGIFAIFRYGAKELPFVSLLIGSLVSTMIPIVSANQTQGLQEIKIKTKQFAHYFFPLSIALLFLSKPLYTFFYGASFDLSAQIFNIYILIVCSRILLPQLPLIVRKERYFLIIASLIETIVNVTLSIILLKQYGLVGIAYATVIANFLNKVMMITFNYINLGIHPKTYIPFKTIAIYSALLWAAFLMIL